ncbi:SDR family oxidoreductase [Actinoplanes couchii]|uniref:Short-chain dehydrogenase/reductase n=1 Tax=Actinoplanes couchii TaxID=403638 RepID=A0ABQ3XTX5_9ACTN|nr:SDR family oxidoreductase [Actinoplanes couchii]MDR6319000.1 NAD(P)-dependent dehydrogenase (short-subunit alcohol dehydrogenase family) [Actinoplanes couchii]GID61974.1 short-chain dehydrogenase/reductase [Actinoplanes couchii]
MTKTVLITGTSSGLGRATAKLFQAEAWNVVATMRRPESETELTRLDNTLVTRLDVEDPTTITAAVRAGLDRFGRLDALVNNAGYGAYGPLEATPMAKIRRQFEVNVFGLLATTQAVLPYLREQRSGVIVNVSSIGGRLTFPFGTPYHGAKFAVEGISEALWYELGTVGVRVKLVEPGGIRTDFGGRSFDFSNEPVIADYQPNIGRVFDVLGPLMADGGSEPEHIADTVFTAVTDGTDRLRYEAGTDGITMLASWRAADDTSFLAGIRQQFGLADVS